MVSWELQEGKYVRDSRLGHRFGINFNGYLEESNANVNTFQLSTDNYGFIHNGINSIRNNPYEENLKKRIIIIGGSLAMGLGASSNKFTLAARLEKIINDRDQNSEVINAACGGYCSWHSVIRLSMDIVRMKPDMVIDISGWNDMLHSSWGPKDGSEWIENHDRSIEDVFLAILAAQKKISFIDHLKNSCTNSNLYLRVKRVLLLAFGRDYSIQDLSWGHDKNKLTYRKKSITNFINNLKTLNGICKSHNIKFVHLLQPNPIWIDDSYIDEIDQASLDIKLHLSKSANLNEFYRKYLSELKNFYKNNSFELAHYKDLSVSNNYVLEDWHDHCHLSDKGQYKLANYIFNNYCQ